MAASPWAPNLSGNSGSCCFSRRRTAKNSLLFSDWSCGSCPDASSWMPPPAQITSSTVAANTRPGLGIEINEAEVKKHPMEQELPQRVWYDDGSVGDW